MTGKRNRDPPILNDDDDYEEWAREIEIWQIMTDLDVTKQGASIYFSLRGKARKCCKTINVEELQGEDGVKKLLETSIYDHYQTKQLEKSPLLNSN